MMAPYNLELFHIMTLGTLGLRILNLRTVFRTSPLIRNISPLNTIEIEANILGLCVFRQGLNQYQIPFS